MNKHNSSISNFKSVFVFFIKALAMFGAIILFCFHISPQYQGDYCASLLDKVNRLEEIEQPKIVLIGDSNLAFGINSEMIEEEFGMPVVNMGLHGALGNAFHEEMAKINVHEGDIYVLCHSYYSDDSSIADPVVAWITIEDNFKLWKLVPRNEWFSMVKAYPTYFNKCLELYVNNSGNVLSYGDYSRGGFNQYGDVKTEREKSKYTFTFKIKPSPINDITINRINKLDEYLSLKGATLVVAGYPIGEGDLTASKEEFVLFQKELEDKLTCPVISDFTDYMIDYKYFYDTHLHLTNEGAEIRTRQLIQDLEIWMLSRGIKK